MGRGVVERRLVMDGLAQKKIWFYKKPNLVQPCHLIKATLILFTACIELHAVNKILSLCL